MPRFLAIDADANGLFVAAATVTRGAVVVERVASRPAAPPLTPATAAGLGAAVRELLTQAGIKPAPVLLCVGRDRVIPKEIRHPPTPPADEPAVVKFQALKELADAGDDIAMDYAPLPPTTAGERRALVVFARKDVLVAARLLCEAADLKLAAVTPRPFAAVAAFRHATRDRGLDADECVAVLTVGPAGGEFTVARGGHIAFSRAVPEPAAANEALLVAELRRNLTIYAGMPAAPPVRTLFVAEATDPTREGLADRLGDVLPVPVSRFDPFAHTGDTGTTVPPAVRGGFAGVLGLFAAKAADDILPINLASPRQPRAAADPNRPRILVAALVAVLVLGVGAAIGTAELGKAGRAVADATNERSRVDDDLQRFELDAKRLAAADEFANREVVWLDEVYDLADRFPDLKKMRAVEIEATAIVPKAVSKVGVTAPPAGPLAGSSPGVGSGPAAPPKPAKPQPVGQLKLVLTTDEPALVDRLVDSLNRDGFYPVTSKTTAGLSGGSSKSQQFTVTTQILHRSPADYRRRLTTAPPPKPADPEPAKGPDKPKTSDWPEDGFPGGFGGFP